MKLKGIRLKYVEIKKGRYYWSPPAAYLREGFPLRRRPLGRDLSAAIRTAQELAGELASWRAGHEVVALPKGTIKWLCWHYQQSREYLSVSPVSRKDYDYAIKRLECTERGGVLFGDVEAASIAKPMAKRFYSELRALRGNGGGGMLIRVMRMVYNWAIGEGLITIPQNPFAGLRVVGSPSRTVVWKRAQIEAFCRAAATMGRPSVGLALRLGYELAQRVTDILALRKDQYADGAFAITQSKTGATVRVPLASVELRAAVEAVQTPTVVTSERTGKPYPYPTFCALFKQIRERAGLPKELQFRDQRRTAMTELGDAGATDDEIRSVSGHKTREVVHRYVVSTDAQAENAVAKRVKRAANEF
ncbi:hypothetical protein FACS1894186_5960 [Alphaproteobacteria bacterium]|nr:hypothetical protein FACS1894186_5960 [Alphaproteobacteria bacterium]